MIKNTNNLLAKIYILIFFITLTFQSIFAQIAENDSIANLKQGGVCFRYDDNSSFSIYRKMADIFDKYDAKFSLSINYGDFWTEDYADSIRALQQMGHEIMDHTPNHRTNYIKTSFPISDYLLSDNVSTIPGIDHINGNKLCLEFEKVYLNNVQGSGESVVDKNIIVGDFSGLTEDDAYLYFTKISKLVLISKRVASDTLVITDVWEDEIDLGQHSNMSYFYYNRFNVRLTTDAIRVLAKESLKLAEKYNLERPRVWIQPGGTFPQLTKEELKEALGDSLGYYAAAATQKGKQVYNEYDPEDDERFEMQWGDFFEDYWTLDEVKSTIADRIAKHYLQIGHTHFFALPDGEEAYLAKVDSLLAWLTENNIPIRTYSEWADILYNKENDPYINMFPSLDVDLDKNISELDINGVPDGYVHRYWAGQGQWVVDTVVAGKNQYCYTISGASRICRVDFLAGLEKGKNDFKIKTKGELGDSIEVIFTYGKDSQIPDAVFKFPADTKEWKEYSLEESTNGNTELIIPETETFVSVDILCTDYVSGEVKIKDMFLAKSRVTSVKEPNDILPNKFSLLQNYPNPFNPSTVIKYSIPADENIRPVQLKVYDVLGNEVATLVNKEQAPGSYEVTFNGTNIASGVYFYALKSNSFFQIKKMILLK